MWCSLNLAVTSLHKIFHRLQAEAFRKRKYPKSFVAKLSDAESEAAETQTWLDFYLSCSYISESTHKELDDIYEKIGSVKNFV